MIKIRHRSLKRRSVYKEATKKAYLSIAVDYFEENSVDTDSIIIENNSVLDSVASTSNNYNDTCSVKYSSIIENECSHTFDSEIFNDIISNVSINFEENDLNENRESNINNNNICTYDESQNNIVSKMKEWATKHKITHSAINDLLITLKPDYPELPYNVRTLLQTPRKITVKNVEPGIYYHFGLQQCIENLLSKTHNSLISNCIEILINIDGLPIAKSTSSQFYPILCCIFTASNVEIVSIYHGYEKPNNANVFLKDLVNDINNLTSNGIYYSTKLYSIKIKAFICDAPAKSFITFTKGHSRYYSCTKCYEKGTYINNRICFPNINNLTLRCDSEFRSKR